MSRFTRYNTATAVHVSMIIVIIMRVTMSVLSRNDIEQKKVIFNVNASCLYIGI